MTEKRFTIDEDGNITDTETDRTLYVENKYTECNYFFRLLNQLSEENEELKKEVKQLKNKIKTYNNTHELLKKTIDRLRSDG